MWKLTGFGVKLFLQTVGFSVNGGKDDVFFSWPLKKLKN